MKIDQFRDDENVEIGGVDYTPTSFSIANTPEAFAALSASIYNDQKLAVIRELSCNAYDAHVAAGKKNIPFDIHLPTNFEPYFSVKDYGTGMSDEAVRGSKEKGTTGLYSTYFATNKSQSNDYIGAFGVGSKSPFSYTDGFTVTSRFGGKKRIYSCYLNKGLPDILLQTEEDSDEPNGMEIQFPVKTSDIWEFENKAKIALEFFNPVPNTNFPIQVVKQEYMMEGKGWGLRKDNFSYGNYQISGTRAIQGLVGYKVGEIDESRLTANQLSLSGMNLDLFFNVGDLAVALSRETLKNDDRTINQIIKAFDKVSEEYVDEVKKAIEQSATAWQARIQIYNMSHKFGKLGLNIEELYKAGKFDGVYGKFSFDSKQLYINELTWKNLHITEFNRTSGDYAKKSKVFILDKEQRQDAEMQFLTDPKRLSRYERSIDTDKNTIFVINDLIGGERYLHYHIQHGQSSLGFYERETQAYLIARSSKDVGLDIVKKEALTIIASLGNPPYRLLSELRALYKDEMAPEAEQKKYVARNIVRFNERGNISRYADGYSRKAWRNGWVTADKDEALAQDGTKYYVLIQKLTPVKDIFDDAQRLGDFIGWVRLSKMFGITDEPLYGLKPDSPLLKHPDWVEFSDFVFKQLPALATPKRLQLIEYKTETFDTKYDSFLKEFRPIRLDSVMRTFINHWRTVKVENSVNLSNLDNVIRFASRHDLFEIPAFQRIKLNLEKDWEKILKTYPLLRYINAYSWKTEYSQPLGDYINMIDSTLVSTDETEKQVEEYVS